jgi:hypothetical protein
VGSEKSASRSIITGVTIGRADQGHGLEENTAHQTRRLTVAVISHKPYRMPTDPMYMPLHVGAALHPDVLPDWVQDNTGDNISAKNNKYSELTGLYWLWKNDDSEYQGIVHYRRHFGTANRMARITHRDRFERIIGSDEVLRLLGEYDVILPRERNYYIETVYSHYAHTFGEEQLKVVRQVIAKQQKEYLPAFERVMASKKAHMFNMFIMRNDRLSEYCEWLFPILKSLEGDIDDSNFDSFQSRYPGRISEMLLDVWLTTVEYDFCEVPVVNPEPVKWTRKGYSFIAARFFGKKYSSSF